MRNAFHLLAAGAKVNSKGSSRTPAGGKGTYTTCPLCQRTVPLNFADAHVSVCLATPQPTPRGQSSQNQRESGPLPFPGLGSSTTPHAQLQPEQLTRLHPQEVTATPPVVKQQLERQLEPQAQQLRQSQQREPERKVPIGSNDGPQPDMVVTMEPDGTCPPGYEVNASAPDQQEEMEAAATTATGLVVVATATAAAPQAAPAAPSHVAGIIYQDGHCGQGCGQRQLQQQQTSTQPFLSQPTLGPSGPRCSQAGGVSAFDIMRQSQLRAASRCHTFFLERTSTGCWLGHYWAKGSATPAQQRLASSSRWSVTLAIGSGSAGKAAGGGGGGGGVFGDAAVGKETVVLLTNVPPGDGGAVSWSSADLPSNDLPPEGRWRGGNSVLKSALQKAVRLGRGGCAMRAALHLFKEDGGAAQLLRRLSVVCVEDAILHPGLPLVVWLMAAQAKGFVLGRTHVDAILWLVYQLAVVQVRDGLPDPWGGGGSVATMGTQGGGSGGSNNNTSQAPTSLQQVDELALPAAEACLVKCLLFRASYGGMGGDVRMMRAFAGYWAARFKGVAAPPPPPPPPPRPSPAVGPAGAVAPSPSAFLCHRGGFRSAVAATAQPLPRACPDSANNAAVQPPYPPVSSGPDEPIHSTPGEAGYHYTETHHPACVAGKWQPQGDSTGTRPQILQDSSPAVHAPKPQDLATPLSAGLNPRPASALTALTAHGLQASGTQVESCDPGNAAAAAAACTLRGSGSSGSGGGSSGALQTGQASTDAANPSCGTPVPVPVPRGTSTAAAVTPMQLHNENRASTQADSASNCHPRHACEDGAAFSGGGGPYQGDITPMGLSQPPRRCSGVGFGFVLRGNGYGNGNCNGNGTGTQATPWSGSGHGGSRQLISTDVRVSDAYFAARLQAEDAPPSCGAFVSASQLLSEAVTEQRSLQRMAAAAASRQQSQLQWQQSPYPHPQTPGWSIGVWNSDTRGGDGGIGCGASPPLELEGGGQWAPGRHGEAAAAPSAAAPVSHTSPALTDFTPPTQFTQPNAIRAPEQQDMVWPEWYGSHGRCCGGGVTSGIKVGPPARLDGGDDAAGRIVFEGVNENDERSPWMTYLCSLYAQVPVPVALAMTNTVGPMRRSDVPRSAVDFHVSDVITRLMVERPEVMALAPGVNGGPVAAPEDAEEALKSAMWLFRSSTNPKLWVHRLGSCCQNAATAPSSTSGLGSASGPGNAGACSEHRSLEAQIEQDEASRRRLAKLWEAAASWVDRFSASYIARRFGPP